MDLNTKLLLGKILGEIYRIQNRMEPNACPVKDSTVYGLLSGFESVIDEHLEGIGYISEEDIKNAADVLDVYFKDPEMLEKLEGYYTIEHELEKRGITRTKAIKIFTYFKANGQFTQEIEKMNSQHSPMECKVFELGDYDK